MDSSCGVTRRPRHGSPSGWACASWCSPRKVCSRTRSGPSACRKAAGGRRGGRCLLVLGALRRRRRCGGESATAVPGFPCRMPRFDFYAEPLLSTVEPKTQFLARWGIADSNAPTLLWATSTTYTGHDPENIRRRYVDRAGVSTQTSRSSSVMSGPSCTSIPRRCWSLPDGTRSGTSW